MNISLKAWFAPSILLVLLSGGATAAKFYADNTYLRQDTWVSENRSKEIRDKQDQIDRLEYKAKNIQKLDRQEAWELQRLKSRVHQLEQEK